MALHPLCERCSLHHRSDRKCHICINCGKHHKPPCVHPCQNCGTQGHEIEACPQKARRCPLKAVRDHFGLQPYTRYTWRGGVPLFQGIDEKLRRYCEGDSAAQAANLTPAAQAANVTPAAHAANLIPAAHAANLIPAAQAANLIIEDDVDMAESSIPRDTARSKRNRSSSMRSNSPADDEGGVPIRQAPPAVPGFWTQEGRVLTNVREYYFDTAPGYTRPRDETTAASAKKPRLDHALRLEEKEAQVRQLQTDLEHVRADHQFMFGEVQRLTRELEAMTQERDTWQENSQMKDNDLWSQANKIEELEKALNAKNAQAKEESLNSQKQPRSDGKQAHKKTLGPLGSARGVDERGRATFPDPPMTSQIGFRKKVANDKPNGFSRESRQ